MARPKQAKIARSDHREKYEKWRLRVLSWPLAVDPPDGRRVADAPLEFQEHLIRTLLINKAKRHGGDHWSRSFVDPADLEDES